MNLKILGIDFISKNINISFLNQGKVNEVNGIPNLDLHYYADNQKNTEIFRKILQIYFK
jgi:glutathione synthase/RimK-type ligase-like ATP-grasp enzyme